VFGDSERLSLLIFGTEGFLYCRKAWKIINPKMSAARMAITIHIARIVAGTLGPIARIRKSYAA
jgi:hypothetical protein